MKKILLSSILLLFSAIALAFCPVPVTLTNEAIPCAAGLSSDPSKVHAFLWIQGMADWTNDSTITNPASVGTCTSGTTYGGCDSDGADSVDEICMLEGTGSIVVPWDDCAGGNAGEYGLFMDWSTVPYDGCPSTDSSARAILLIYDDDGNFVLQSRSQSKDWDNWDEIGTSAAEVFSAATGSVSFSGDEGANQADITFTALPDAVKKGSCSTGDAPVTPPVTGFRVYFYPGPFAPTDFSTSAWTAGDVFSASTTSVSNYTFPGSSCSAFMSRALIIDGKELPFVSTGYSAILAPANADGGFDRDVCNCNGICFWNEGNCWPWGPVPYELDALIDGTELILGACSDPWIYFPECEVAHTIQWRTRIGTVVSCWSEARTMIDHNETPVAPVITSIVDNDPNAQSGIRIYYTAGFPADDHWLYRDGYRIDDDYMSGTTVTVDCNVWHSYEIVAFNNIVMSDSPCQYIYSEPVTAADGCVDAPLELAPGLTSGDALLFSNDKTTASWPSYTGATGYRLYRGTKSQLASLATGSVNSCKKYDGTETSASLSSEDPSGVSGSFYWYLVTAYNGAGEGSAGTGRVINSSGTCP